MVNVWLSDQHRGIDLRTYFLPLGLLFWFIFFFSVFVGGVLFFSFFLSLLPLTLGHSRQSSGPWENFQYYAGWLNQCLPPSLSDCNGPYKGRRRTATAATKKNILETLNTENCTLWRIITIIHRKKGRQNKANGREWGITYQESHMDLLRIIISIETLLEGSLIVNLLLIQRIFVVILQADDLLLQIGFRSGRGGAGSRRC